MNRKSPNILPFLLSLVLLFFLFSNLGNIISPSENITVDNLVKLVEKNDIKSITTVDTRLEVRLKDNSLKKVELPSEFQMSFYNNYLKDKVEKGEIRYSAVNNSNNNIFITMLPTLLLLGGFAFFWFFIFSRNQNINRKNMDFGKSKAVLHKEKNNIKFNDVAGLKEEKEEMYELVDFLKNPRKYVEHGARIPKGVLLVGEPGTGKTYISKAVAGEANVPFFSISGSDFVEMFVGVGASRVRDMFNQAKKNAPCIIFIDEIDAVGRRRGAGLGGGNDEREQTLNQLLVEMDGFSKNEGIIIIAATNRPDILDPALLRPGRFDRTIQISMPDLRERVEILKVHTRNKKLADEINLEDIARATVGFSPAEIENVTNEAALLAARTNKSEINSALFEEAIFRVMAGPEKKSKVVIEQERILTAYHESGHAITAEFLKYTDPVQLITIIPRGPAGGFTSYVPDEDKFFRTKQEMENRLVALLGGRAAEAVALDDISTGASNDIEKASKIARAMIKVYGFSEELGPVQYEDGSGNIFLGGNDYSNGDLYSEETAVKIDREVTKLMKDAYNKAVEIIENNRDFLEELAQRLLEKETVRQNEYREIADKYIGKE